MLQEEQRSTPVEEAVEGEPGMMAGPLPPVHVTAPSGAGGPGEETLALWLRLGALDKLEQAVLDGYGGRLAGRTSRIPQVSRFLRLVPQFQHKIREVHRAVAEGDLRAVRHLLDRRKLALARDQIGASPLHKAVVYGHRPVIAYLLEKHSAALHARDHQGRTPLHYAAFLLDRGSIYDMLVESGADTKATDIYGKMPEDYLQTKDEAIIKQLREGVLGIRRINPPSKTHKNGRLNLPGPTISVERSQVQEILSKGDVELLEDLVLQGYGTSLLGRSSSDPGVQEFLNSVPSYMERMYETHRAAMRGKLGDLQKLLSDNEKLALARDQLGATPLHKAIWYRRLPVVQFLSTNHPATLAARDHEGRTSLHYAATQGEDKGLYDMLLSAGASKNVLDCWDKTPDYYLLYPDQLRLEETIRRSQRANANYLASTINHYRYKFTNASTPSDASSAGSSESGEKPHEETELVPPKPTKNMSHNGDSIIQNNPPLPLLRLRISSATIRQWLREDDVEKLELAVLEGYADKVARTAEDPQPESVSRYLREVVPEVMASIAAVHAAVAEDDLAALQSRLSGDGARLAMAKDSLGMTPLHHAVVLRHTKIVKFLVDKFPETVQARDKEGRTPLHYASLVSRNDGMNTYKLLVLAGADPRVRDQHGRTPDYYRNHPLFIPSSVLSRSKAANYRWLARNMEPLSKLGRNGVLEKISSALRKSDVDQLREVVLEGYGRLLHGKTSWNDDVRQFLKSVPQYMSTMRNLQDAVKSGDLATVEDTVDADESLLRCRDETGATPIHLAAAHNQTAVLRYFVDNYPVIINVKDAQGRTPLHIACQLGLSEVNRLLQEGGADVMILDQKGRTPEYYLFQGANGVPSRFYSSSRKPLPGVEPLPRLESTTNGDDVGNEERLDTAFEEAMLIENDVTDLKKRFNPEENGDELDEERDEYKDDFETDQKEEVANIENGSTERTNEVVERTSEENEDIVIVAIIQEAVNGKEETTRNVETDNTENVSTDLGKDLTELNNVNRISENDSEQAAKQSTNTPTNDNFEPLGENIQNSSVNDDSLNASSSENMDSQKIEIVVQDEEPDPQPVQTEEESTNKSSSKTNESNNDEDKNQTNNTALINETPTDNINENEEKEVIETNEITENDNNKIDQQPLANEDDNETNEESSRNEREVEDLPNEINNINDKTENAEENREEAEEQEPKVDADITDTSFVITYDEKDISLGTSNEISKADVPDDSPEVQDTIEVQENDREEVATSDPPDYEIVTEVPRRTHNPDILRVEQDEVELIDPDLGDTSAGREELSPTKPQDNPTSSNEAADANSISSRDHLDDLIDQWIREGDLLRLEHVVLAGQGERLTEKSSTERQVQDFLDLVPIYMAKIRTIHEAVVRGNVREVRSVLTRKRFALSRDHRGASPLHLAALLGHAEVLQYIVAHFPETLEGPDNEGRTPLHYAAVIQDGGNIYALLKEAGADESIPDKLGNTPKSYLSNQNAFNIQELLNSYRTADEYR